MFPYPEKRKLNQEMVHELGLILYSKTDLNMPSMCIHCGSNIYGNPLICGVCCFVSYCSKQCAKMHKEEHKEECEELKKGI
jgi:hypothetical protein